MLMKPLSVLIVEIKLINPVKAMTAIQDVIGNPMSGNNSDGAAPERIWFSSIQTRKLSTGLFVIGMIRGVDDSDVEYIRADLSTAPVVTEEVRSSVERVKVGPQQLIDRVDENYLDWEGYAMKARMLASTIEPLIAQRDSLLREVEELKGARSEICTLNTSLTNCEEARDEYLGERDALLKENELLVKKITEFEAAQAWESIDTAPRDGTEIVLFGNLKSDPKGKKRACLSWWSDDENKAPAYAVGWQWSTPGYADLFEPTHWRHQPPKET